jgi:hypothetical protein
MPGFSDSLSNAQDLVFCHNADFSGATFPVMTNGLQTDGQLWIGSTALNAGGTHVNVGHIFSPNGTIDVGFSGGNITLDTLGGSASIENINVQTGTSPIVPLVGVITINGAVVAAGVNPVRTDGTGPNTLAVEVQTSQAIAAADATKIGLSNFSSAQFSVAATGFVTLSGGTTAPVLGLVPDAHTGPGTTPVVPTGGNITVTGSSTAAGSTPVQTNSLAANTLTVQVQKSQAIVGTDATKVGLAAFSNTQFAVDANGFVSLLGGSGKAIETIKGNDGTAEVPDAFGVFNFLTANTTVKFAGSANTETLDFGLTNLIIGSSSTSINFATSNVGLGEGSLNSLTSGENNVCVGFNSGNATSTGINNVSIGNDALLLMTGSVQNVAVGASALNTLQVSTGSNTGIGYNALGGITTGTQNTALGVNAGSTYGTSESSNIVIGNTGTLSESNTIRIGVNGSSAGQQNRAFIAGITGVTVVGPLVNISSTGQLGALANGTTGQVLTGSTGASPVWAAPATSGTVTSVSVVSANGFAGTVATATTTPAITLSTTITGILQGNGTAISAASTNGSGNIVLTTSPTLVTPVLGVAAATSVSFPSAGGTGTATSDIQSYYEEGTWVPTAVGGTTAGTTTYTTQVGAYIRIGSCVHVIGTFTYSAATGTGVITLGGLPFTIKNTSNLLPTGSAVTSSSTITWPVGTTSLAIQGLVNTTTAKFACCGTGVGAASVQMANAGTTFNFSFFYFV